MGQGLVTLFFMLNVQFMVIISVFGLPPGVERRYNLNNLNATSAIGALANTDSNASATGPGSTVEISGIVSGETSSSVDSQSLSTDPGASSISSTVNCSEYSTSSASGGLSADALASGDCLMHIDNSGSHNFESSEKSTGNAIGMEGQVNSHSHQNGNPPPPSSQEAQITQATIQNTMEGSAEAYQLVSGPQATSAFSGIMSNAQPEAVHGTQETLMTHSSGDTNIQSLIIPFGAVATQSVLFDDSK